MLRLVGGTTVKRPKNDSFSRGLEEAVAAVSSASEEAQKALARRLVLAHIVDGKSVQTHLNELNQGVLNQAPTLSESMRMSSEAIRTLFRIGIGTSTGGRKAGIETEVYAFLYELKPLFREIPALKKLSIDLQWLPLY